ncbi:restriction modification system DNA specificity domain protein, partial [mine drainage metagenome]
GLAVGDVPFIKVSDMNLAANAIAVREANNWVDDNYLARVRAKPFPSGTTVFAKIGEALRQNRVRKIVRPTLIDNNMMGAIPNLNVISAEFLYYRLAIFDIAATATGTALPYLTVSTLERQRFRIPPIEEQ